MGVCPCGYDKQAHLQRHVLKCRIAPLIFENAQLQKKVSADAETIRNLEIRLDELRQNPLVQNVQNVQNNVTIQLFAYGNEPSPTREDVMRILHGAPAESIPRFLQLKHFRYAKTSNLRIDKRRPGVLERYETDRVSGCNSWVKRAKRDAIEKLINCARDELVDDFHADLVPRWQSWDDFITGDHKDVGRKKNQMLARKELAVRVEGVIV